MAARAKGGFDLSVQLGHRQRVGRDTEICWVPHSNFAASPRSEHQTGPGFLTIVAGTAIGAGLGILAPGGNKSMVKGMLIGGSGASALYLWTHRNPAGGWTPWRTARS